MLQCISVLILIAKNPSSLCERLEGNHHCHPSRNLVTSFTSLASDHFPLVIPVVLPPPCIVVHGSGKLPGPQSYQLMTVSLSLGE